MSIKESDHYRSQYGAYDYRTVDAERREATAREKEREWSWEPDSGPTYTYGGGGGGGAADGWTAIAGLLLVGLSLVVAYHVIIFVFEVYLHGLSPYLYFLEALTRHVGLYVLLFALLFIAAQLLPFLLFVQPRSVASALVYAVALPPLNVALYYLGWMLVDLSTPVLDLRPLLSSVAAGLPRDVQLPLDLRAGTVVGALPVGLLALLSSVAAFYLLCEACRYTRLGVFTLMRWSLRAFEQAAGSPGGQILLVLLAVALLTGFATLVTLPPRMPLGVDSFLVVLVGLMLGWRLGGIAAAAWLALGLVGVPVLGAASIGALAADGGYLVGLVLAAIIAGLRAKTARPTHVLLLVLAASSALVGSGLVWLWYWTGWGLDLLWQRAVWPFVPGLAVNGAIAACVFLAGDALGRAALAARPARQRADAEA